MEQEPITRQELTTFTPTGSVPCSVCDRDTTTALPVRGDASFFCDVVVALGQSREDAEQVTALMDSWAAEQRAAKAAAGVSLDDAELGLRILPVCTDCVAASSLGDDAVKALTPLLEIRSDSPAYGTA